MAYVIGTTAIAAIALLMFFILTGERYGFLAPVQHFAPNSGAALIDQKTDDGSIIEPLSMRPYYGNYCQKRVRGEALSGFCWR